MLVDTIPRLTGTLKKPALIRSFLEGKDWKQRLTLDLRRV